jgi:hypothetical protein
LGDGHDMGFSLLTPIQPSAIWGGWSCLWVISGHFITLYSQRRTPITSHHSQRTGKPGVAEITECSRSPSASVGSIDQYPTAN